MRKLQAFSSDGISWAQIELQFNRFFIILNGSWGNGGGKRKSMMQHENSLKFINDKNFQEKSN